MKLRTLIVALVALFAIPAAAIAQDEIVGFFGGDENSGTHIKHYKCKYYGSCPRLRIADSVGEGLRGCEFSEATKTCSGSCTVCGGSTTPASACVVEGGETCYVGGAGQADCGEKFANPCFYTGAGGPIFGLPQPCNCPLYHPGDAIDSSCSVANCQV